MVWEFNNKCAENLFYIVLNIKNNFKKEIWNTHTNKEKNVFVWDMAKVTKLIFFCGRLHLNFYSVFLFEFLFNGLTMTLE